MWEPPVFDRKQGIIYLRCPEWFDCEDCSTNCAFNPNIKFDPIKLVDYKDIQIPRKLWVRQ